MTKLETPDLRALVRNVLKSYKGITEQEVIDLVDEIHCQRLSDMRGDLNPVPQEMLEKVKAGKMDLLGETDG